MIVGIDEAEALDAYSKAVTCVAEELSPSVVKVAQVRHPATDRQPNKSS